LGDFDKAMLKGNYVISSKSKDFLKAVVNNSDVTNLIYNVSKDLGTKDKYIFVDRMLKLNFKDTPLLNDFTSIKKLENRISL